jgi:hypothetical protein
MLIDLFKVELWSLDLEFSCKFHFWINYADIEMKLGTIVYNDDLQLKNEFCNY